MPDATPTLALCIPAYNAAWCLPRLLASAAAQTVPFDEIIVYDDASTDGTAAVARVHGARVVSTGENVGCSAGKNRLAEATTADWIHFHDADDELLPDFVATVRPHLARADSPDVLLVGYDYLDFETREHLGSPDWDPALARRDAVAFVLAHKVPNFAVYRRRLFLDAGGFDLDPAVLYNEDAAVHHRLALAGLRFDVEPAVTSLNFRYGVSMSVSNQQRCARAQVAVLDKTTDALRARGDLLTYATTLANNYWAVASFAATTQAWDAAARAARAASALGRRTPPAGSAAFRALATLHAPLALRLREHAIRTLRPHLRAA